MLDFLETGLVAFGNWAWGTHLLVLLVGGGLFFAISSGFRPYKYIRHSIQLLTGKYEDPNAPGDLNHFQALASALAATVAAGQAGRSGSACCWLPLRRFASAGCAGSGLPALILFAREMLHERWPGSKGPSPPTFFSSGIRWSACHGSCGFEPSPHR